MSAWDGTGEWRCEESYALDELTGCGAEVANIVCEVPPGDRARAVANLVYFHEGFPLQEMALSHLRMSMEMHDFSENDM